MLRSHRSLVSAVALCLLCLSVLCGPATFGPVAYAADNTYNVDNTGDADVSGSPPYTTFCTGAPGDCSLRQAIRRSNVDSGSSEINFDLLATSDPNYASGFWTIRPQSALPALSAGQTTIRGRSNFLSQPGVVIDGGSVPASQATGLQITSPTNIIQRLVIVNFVGNSSSNGFGILITGVNATGNRITGNYVGRKPQSNDVVPNSQAGIRIIGASGNFIGEPGDAGRNYISGNGANGILLINANSNTIANNFIGVVVNAAAAITPAGNSGFGIQLENSAQNTIGSTVVDSFNIISSNTSAGVYMIGTQTISNTLVGNYVGVNEAGIGAAGFGNGDSGIQIVNGASNNTITGTPNARTVIGGNTGYGVLLTDGETSGNRIENSFIGVGDNGLAAPNTRGGVAIRNNANNNVIGSRGAGNVISGNTGYGIRLEGDNAPLRNLESNSIVGNIIGLDPSGAAPVGNTGGGVLLENGSKLTLIGGTDANDRNIISSNSGAGIVISGTATLSNTVVGNTIGLRRTTANGPYNMATDAGNTGDGILVGAGASFTVIGGTATAAGNTIAASGANGVEITGTGTLTTTIASNTIGTALLSASTEIANSRNTLNGVLVGGGALGTTIRRNTIRANGANGVLVSGQNTARVTIVENSITRNGLLGIDLNPDTTTPIGDPANPNHDINPPFNLRINQARQLTGRVLVDQTSDQTRAASCITCTVQLYAADPALKDGEGKSPVLSTTFTLDRSGYFTATLQSIPAQLVATATDFQGNTSEAAVFEASFGLEITPELQSQSAAPTQSITYTHRIRNTGSVDFTDVRVTAVPEHETWDAAVLPPAPISLRAGETKDVTVTVTLPAAPDDSVDAGLLDRTRVTVASTAVPTATDVATDTTTVLAQFVLDIDPTSSRGSAAPEDSVVHGHTLTNNGNLTGTLEMTATTDLGWPTETTPLTATLAPGQSIDLSVQVTVPASTNAGTEAKTTVTIVPSVTGEALPRAPIYLTDTTVALLEPLATMVFDQEKDAGADETVIFEHTITSFSNGPTKYQLSALSSLGSTVTFTSNTPGITIAADNTFTLDPTANPPRNVLRFTAEVRVSRFALRGQTDTVFIRLLEEDGSVVGGASVEDTINVVRSAIIPRQYLPLIRNER